MIMRSESSGAEGGHTEMRPDQAGSEPLAPRGFRAFTGNLGIKDDTPDFTAVVSEVPAAVAAVFTRSRFAGPSVTLSRASAADGCGRGVVVISKNANVATGPTGTADALEVRGAVAARTGLEADDLLIASTGVIGRQYPMDRIRPGLATLEWPFPDADFDAVARAIMTTDTHAKVVRVPCGNAVIVGVAKGVGMIEPNMATLLTFFFTDAQLPPGGLDAIFRRVVDRTFNALSIDTDTSTSDTAAVFANGLAGPVDPEAFEACLYEAALTLVKQIARDGEGATTLIEVRVTGARDADQAKRVGKSVVNSPLVKTAVHGADPNWGRVAMAVGKAEDDTDIDPDKVRICFGDVEVYPAAAPDALERAEEHLRGDDVLLGVDLGIGTGEFTVYGCDLTDGYIRINADYTT
jgi:glutamate N-acetyltransferase/amino-acid N-acetyltransferase